MIPLLVMEIVVMAINTERLLHAKHPKKKFQLAMELTLKPLTKFGLGWAEVVTQVEREEKTDRNHHTWTVAVDTQARSFPLLYRHYNILEGKYSRSQIPTTVLKSKRFWSTKGFYWFCGQLIWLIWQQDLTWVDVKLIYSLYSSWCEYPNISLQIQHN